MGARSQPGRLRRGAADGIADQVGNVPDEIDSFAMIHRRPGALNWVERPL